MESKVSQLIDKLREKESTVIELGTKLIQAQSELSIANSQIQSQQQQITEKNQQISDHRFKNQHNESNNTF